MKTAWGEEGYTRLFRLFSQPRFEDLTRCESRKLQEVLRSNDQRGGGHEADDFALEHVHP
jgi:hypothetical protein